MPPAVSGDLVALIDYGAGNVLSVHKALEAVGARVRRAYGPTDLVGAAKIVLPGVGAFGDCMDGLRRLGLIEPLCQAVRAGIPLLGICVGMQVLFEEGEELGIHAGLGLLPGRVIRLPADLTARGLKIPHTGWNQIEWSRPHPLLANLAPGVWVYFNHSYVCQSRPEHTLAITEYGCSFPAVVGHGNLLGVQFHPEKSQRVGLQILRNFVEGSV